jgi:microcystin-dependent protein
MSFLQNQVSIETFPGTVIPYTGATAPNGWLLCNGDPYSRTTYSALYNVIGTAYNTTTTSATDFNVPNFQAAFLRGAGSQTYPTGVGGTTYAASAINTAQGTATKTHNHDTNQSQNHSHSISDTGHTHTPSASTHAHNSQYEYYTAARKTMTGMKLITAPGSQTNRDINTETTTDLRVSLANANNPTIDNTSLNVSSVGNNSGKTNATESIPFNYAINWIIKY